MSKVARTWGLVTLAIVMAGCATTGGGQSPEDQIRANLDPWAQAFIAKDIDTVMSFYSEDFTHYEYTNKAGLADFLKGAADTGMLDSAAVDMAATAVTVDGDTAKAGPIGTTGAFGSAVISLDLKNEGGDWKIVGMDVQMQ